MSDTLITAICGGVVVLLGGGIPAIIALRKARQEITQKTAEAELIIEEKEAALAKKARNGVIEDFEKALHRCGARNDSMEAEISELRTQITKLYGEISELRKLIAAKETRVESQATQVDELRTAVTVLKDLAPVTHLPEGTEVKIPESTMKEEKPAAPAKEPKQ